MCRLPQTCDWLYAYNCALAENNTKGTPRQPLPLPIGNAQRPRGVGGGRWETVVQGKVGQGGDLKKKAFF